MPALSVLDLALFLLESPDRHFNVGPLILLDPPEGQRANFADRLYARMLKRPAGAPFTYRLSQPTVGLPSLEEDPDFDLTRHVHRLTLKAPGTQKQLLDHVATLHQKPLDRALPLWQLYVIDGLEDGKVALYGKMHHGVIDGRTFVKVVSNWLALSPTDRTVRAMWEGLPKRESASAERASAADLLRGGLDKAVGTASTFAALYRMLAGQALGRAAEGKTMMVPFTRIPKVLRGHSSTKRCFAYCTLPIDQMKALAKKHGASLNDLLLLTLDVALDRYLQELGTRPDKPLVTAMPVALSGATGGNQIAILQFPLGAPGQGAAGRLADIRRSTATIKNVVQREASETVMLYTTLVHGVPAILEKLGIGDPVTVSNLVVSNPFGLLEKRYLMGARVDLALPISTINAGQTLNVTAVTLDDQLQVTLLGLPDAVPDIDKLAQYVREALDSLQGTLSAPAAIANARVKRATRARAAPRRAAAAVTQAVPARRVVVGVKSSAQSNRSGRL
jgi:diacylglycerol O-acyltransferase